MKYQAIGFDYGGVIAGMPGPVFEQKVIKILNTDLPTFQNTYFEFNYLLNQNTLSLESFWEKICEELMATEQYPQLMTFLKGLSSHEINEQLIALNDHLRNKGYKTGLLSNNTLETANRLRQNGLAAHFDVFMVSAEIGFNKPDPKAFELFIDALQVKPDALIFIDDTPKSLIHASQIGFHPLLFTNFEQLEKNLQDLGIIG